MSSAPALLMIVALAHLGPRGAAPPAGSSPWRTGSPVGADESPNACVRVRAEARYRNYGYDHIVHLQSRCTMDVACAVWTDVSPIRIRASLAPGQEVEVL